MLTSTAFAEPPPRSIPSSQVITKVVPVSGPLYERELTLLAIAHRPQLERLRGAVKVAVAQQRASHDLEEPELRVSYAYDADERLDSPYIERETLSGSSQESFDSLTNSTTLAGTTTDAERGSISSNRTRVIERRVTPGATKDVIEEQVYETDSSTTITSRDRTRLGTTSPESEKQNEHRRLVGSTRRVIEHPDTSGRDNAWGAMLRFKLPHPWERRARIQRAAAEVSLAEADYFVEEDVVVRTVRASYQELAILEAKLDAQKRRKTAAEGYRDWLEKQQSPRIGLELAAARAKIYGTLADIRSMEGDAAYVRRDLAIYCGLADASRIITALAPRVVAEPAKLDVSYLSSISMLYRGDMLGSQARLAIAGALLAQANAASIPFGTFIDLGYTQQNSLRRTGQSDEWFARIGISIPLWEWTGFNKQTEVPKAATLTLEQQVNLQRSLVTNEINQAVKRLVSADAQLANCDKDIADLKADLKKSLNETQLATSDVNDVVKAKRIEQDFQDLTQQMELNRYAALSGYHEALMALEKAMGVRIEQVLNRTVPSEMTKSE
jgi:outer membrane protein TolC